MQNSKFRIKAKSSLSSSLAGSVFWGYQKYNSFRGRSTRPPTEGWVLLIVVLQKINTLRGLRSCRAPLSSHCANFGKSERVIFAVKKCDRLIASNARSDILGKNHT
jgi:hypothetical protein